LNPTKEETEMDITIDITRGIDHDGIARRYYPQVHWTLDEQDSISPDTMRKIADNVKFCVESGLKEV
jgi:hypothetical protein